eukprot:scaffold1171_cov234-Pinguiococcus_pyrenoidosus.AAC.3
MAHTFSFRALSFFSMSSVQYRRRWQLSRCASFVANFSACSKLSLALPCSWSSLWAMPASYAKASGRDAFAPLCLPFPSSLLGLALQAA